MIRANGMTTRHSPRGGWLGLVATVLIASRIAVAAGEGVFDVRDYGAVGDGKTLDTAAINKAVEACAQAGGGQVRFPPGRYLSATVHLKSHVTLYLEAGARLIGAKDPNLYEHPTVPSFMPEARWGKWHRALILADGAEDIEIAGPASSTATRSSIPPARRRCAGRMRSSLSTAAT